MISVDFPGGSVAQLVAAVNKPDGHAFNLLGETEDLATRLPAFSVRNVNPSAFAMALRQLLEPRGITVMPEGPDLFVLRKVATMVRREPVAFESFQLSPYLDKQSVEDIVSAMRTAWELNPANKPEELQLKFHPATRLLLASGSADAIRVASKVLSTLSRTPEKLSNAEQELLQSISDQIRQDQQKRTPTAPAAPGKK